MRGLLSHMKWILIWIFINIYTNRMLGKSPSSFVERPHEICSGAANQNNMETIFMFCLISTLVLLLTGEAITIRRPWMLCACARHAGRWQKEKETIEKKLWTRAAATDNNGRWTDEQMNNSYSPFFTHSLFLLPMLPSLGTHELD